MFTVCSDEQAANEALPAFENLGLAAQLAFKLCMQALCRSLGKRMMRWNCWMGMPIGFGMVAIWQAKGLVQDGPMPVTETVQHSSLLLSSARTDGDREEVSQQMVSIETIVPEDREKVNIVSRKLSAAGRSCTTPVIPRPKGACDAHFFPSSC
jgi:hypothetical protein